MFGKIIEQNVLLLSNDNKFIEVDTELINSLLIPKNKIDQSDCDAFLFKATKSWWLAKSKIWTISATKGFLERQTVAKEYLLFNPEKVLGQIEEIKRYL